MACNKNVFHLVVSAHNLTTQKRDETREELDYVYASVARPCLMNRRRYAQLLEAFIATKII